MKYDIIGDIHGHAKPLEELLIAMDYLPSERGFVAPSGRQAVFVGDLIDRGPDQVRVLEIVRTMVETGNAKAVLGNHEFNAIGFATMGESGEYLRPRSKKNRSQHKEFLAQVGEDSVFHNETIAWFKTLPMVLDLGGIRVAHAWWDEKAVELINECYWDADGCMSNEFLHASHVPDSPLLWARKTLTCGVEWDLPEGVVIKDKEGHEHKEARLAVWRHWATKLHEIALVPGDNAGSVPDIAIPADLVLEPITGAPVFIGHHWFSGPVKIETNKLAVLDFSVAKSGGLLVAYRWNGEAELHDGGFIQVVNEFIVS